VDEAWNPFIGRPATIPEVTTLPVHFSGQTSRLFQIASHISYFLRVALIFHETHRRIGRPSCAVGLRLRPPAWRSLSATRPPPTCAAAWRWPPPP
jgi:hypothetical protein